MKKSLQLLVLLMMTISTFGCEKESYYFEESETILHAIEDVLALGLKEEFAIPQEVFEEFIRSFNFEGHRLRGFFYQGIDDVLMDEESISFWGHFGITLERHLDMGIQLRNREIAFGDIHVDCKGYRTYCEHKEGWVCIS